MFQQNIIAKSFVFILVSFLIASCTPKQDKQHTDSNQDEEMNHSYAYGIRVDSLNLHHYEIKKGDCISSILMNLGFTGSDPDRIAQTITPLYPPSKLQIGNRYATISSPDSTSAVQYLVFERSKTDFVVVDMCTDSIKVHESTKPITLQRKYVEGTINSSLWNTIIESGSSPMLALKLSDLYAWQIDFFDTKQGDSFRLIYDEAWVDDTTFLEIASIEGAMFNHQGRKFTAVPFEQDSTREYFDEEGNSLRKEFLKAPLDFFRISSKFSNARYHPVLKRYRAHHGVDYAAPTGTPVKTVGDGVVVAKGLEDCYHSLFYDCVQLTSGPLLPAQNLVPRCYAHMFRGCTSLSSAPVLPATNLADSCYTYMFRGCTSLSVAPSLPATTLQNS